MASTCHSHTSRLLADSIIVSRAGRSHVSFTVTLTQTSAQSSSPRTLAFERVDHLRHSLHIRKSIGFDRGEYWDLNELGLFFFLFSFLSSPIFVKGQAPTCKPATVGGFLIRLDSTLTWTPVEVSRSTPAPARNSPQGLNLLNGSLLIEVLEDTLTIGIAGRNSTNIFTNQLLRLRYGTSHQVNRQDADGHTALTALIAIDGILNSTPARAVCRAFRHTLAAGMAGTATYSTARFIQLGRCWWRSGL